jgi:hypothetical protein
MRIQAHWKPVFDNCNSFEILAAWIRNVDAWILDNQEFAIF